MGKNYAETIARLAEENGWLKDSISEYENAMAAANARDERYRKERKEMQVRIDALVEENAAFVEQLQTRKGKS